MHIKSISILLSFLLIVPAYAGAVSEKDFHAQTTENMINLCSASPDDPMYIQAVNFCHGYLVGAYHYHEASASGAGGVKMVCAPNPPPSRDESIGKFIEWAKAHPQYWSEPPVETEFRFLIEKWPCSP